MFNPLKYFQNRKVGVALGSGGAKGLAHIAVLDYLETEGIPVHMIAGSSIGAVVGALYSIGRMRDFRNELLNMDWKEMLSLVDPVFPRMGMIEGKKLRTFLSRFIPESTKLEDLPVPLSVVATDYVTGQPVVFNRGNVLDALRASIAIPGVFTPVYYGDSLLIDGGVSNPLPVDVVKRMGAGLTIAVNLHPAIHGKFIRRAVKKAMGSPEATDTSGIKTSAVENAGKSDKGTKTSGGGFAAIAGLLKFDQRGKKEEKKHEPNIFHIISQAIDIMEYMNTVMILKVYNPNVVIQPDLMDLPTLDFTGATRALSEGYTACRNVRRQLRRKIRLWV